MNKVESLERPDPEVIAATRTRLAAAAAAAGHLGEDDAPATGAEAVSVGILEERLQTVVLDRGDRWDCESVLSLRSNLDNHPGRIVEPQKRTGGKGGAKITLSHKTGMSVVERGAGAAGMGVEEAIPEGPEGGEESVQGSGDESGSGGEGEGGGVLLERRKGETAEERRVRKAAVKEARRANRAAKKELKGLFKGEAKKQTKQAAGRAVMGGGVGMGSSTYVLS